MSSWSPLTRMYCSPTRSLRNHKLKYRPVDLRRECVLSGRVQAGGLSACAQVDGDPGYVAHGWPQPTDGLAWTRLWVQGGRTRIVVTLKNAGVRARYRGLLVKSQREYGLGQAGSREMLIRTPPWNMLHTLSCRIIRAIIKSCAPVSQTSPQKPRADEAVEGRTTVSAILGRS